jgi:hypothetical protein
VRVARTRSPTPGASRSVDNETDAAVSSLRRRPGPPSPHADVDEPTRKEVCAGRSLDQRGLLRGRTRLRRRGTECHHAAQLELSERRSRLDDVDLAVGAHIARLAPFPTARRRRRAPDGDRALARHRWVPVPPLGRRRDVQRGRLRSRSGRRAATCARPSRPLERGDAARLAPKRRLHAPSALRTGTGRRPHRAPRRAVRPTRGRPRGVVARARRAGGPDYAVGVGSLARSDSRYRSESGRWAFTSCLIDANSGRTAERDGGDVRITTAATVPVTVVCAGL